MPDREKLLKGLKCCIKSDRGCFCPDDCPYDDNDKDYCETLIKLDALSLLKEQPEIVRCKDCAKKGNPYEFILDNMKQEYGGCRTEEYDNWFCAYGERKTGGQNE